MEEFRVSVIIPVFNAEKYLERAVESATSLKVVSEILLVEDCSADSSMKVCIELENKYDIVKLIQHPDKKNHGAGPSRNLGLENAISPFVSFLDADDYFLSNRFEITQKVFAQNKDADGVYEFLGIKFENETAKEKWREIRGNHFNTYIKINIPPEDLGYALLNKNIGSIHLDTLTIKKNSINQIRFTEHRIAQDTLFILKLSIDSRLYPGNLSNPVAIRGVHGENRITTSKETNITHTIHILEYLSDWLQNRNNKTLQKTIRSLSVKYQIDKSRFIRPSSKRTQYLLKIYPEIWNQKLHFHKYFIKYVLAFLNIYF